MTFGLTFNIQPYGQLLVEDLLFIFHVRGNAFWNNTNKEASFCNGFVMRDVVSHELTHGLVQNSGGTLDYVNKSGALNESFADVFGEIVDCRTADCDWQICSLRDLANPLNQMDSPLQSQCPGLSLLHALGIEKGRTDKEYSGSTYFPWGDEPGDGETLAAG